MSLHVLSGSDEGPAKTYRNEGESVFVTGTIRTKAGELRCVATDVEIDFTDVTLDECRAYAARWAFINKVQTHFRAAKNDASRETVLNTVYNMRAILDAPRAGGTRDPVKGATNALAKLTDAEFLAVVGVARPTPGVDAAEEDAAYGE